MVNKKIRDGVLLGAVGGLLLTVPKISSTVSSWLSSVVPTNLLFLDSLMTGLSIPVFAMAVGMVIGLIVDAS